MAGDHKCSVCSATFTRPQHVVRHMRSHTGDRPYKCQHCGDQFSRSDLLSRHVNKCHVNEKASGTTVTTNDTHGRRKGMNAGATRATTSKQACDQCVQSSLPCDGCNPCAKCVQRKVRCTFVKFHRQTAPIGPGHNPSRQSNAPSTSHPPSMQQHQPPNYNSATPMVPGPLYSGFEIPHSLPSNYPGIVGYGEDDQFILNPAPGPSYNYRSQQSDLHRRASFPSSSAQNQAWLGWHASSENHGGPNPAQFGADTGSQFAFDIGADYREPPFTLRHPHQNQSHPHQNQSHPHLHPSASTVSFSSSSSSSSNRDPYTDSRPGSASSFGGDDPPSRPGTSSSFAASRPGTSSSVDGSSNNSSNGGFSSAFGLMSLDDPAVLAGLADGTPFFSHLNQMPDMNNHSGSTRITLEDVNDAVGTGLGMRNDPDATPMPMGEAQAMGLIAPGHREHSSSSSNSPSHQSQHFPRARPSTGHGRSSNPNWGPVPSSDIGTPGRDAETRELRDFWKAYMRTPLSGPGGSNGILGAPSSQGMHMLSSNGGNGMNSSLGPPSGTAPSGYRRQRVSSMPTVKTPPALTDEERYTGSFIGLTAPYERYPPPLAVPSHRGNNQQNYQSQGAPAAGATMHGNAEDLRSYEAAVLARKAPVNLSMSGLGGKMRRKAGGSGGGARNGNDFSNIIGRGQSHASPSFSGSSPSSTSASSVSPSPSIPQSIPQSIVDDIANRPSFKRGASQVLEKSGSGKFARRASNAMDHEFDAEVMGLSVSGGGGGGLQASA